MNCIYNIILIIYQNILDMVMEVMAVMEPTEPMEKVMPAAMVIKHLMPTVDLTQYMSVIRVMLTPLH